VQIPRKIAAWTAAALFTPLAFGAGDGDARTRTQAALEKTALGFEGRMGIFAKDLATGETFAVRADEVFPQASTIKIPILIEVFRQAAEGRFSLDDLRTIRGDEKVGGSGVLRQLGTNASAFALRDLATLMIVESDNVATNVLIDLVGMEGVNRTLEGWGLEKTRVRRKMMDLAASARGAENVSTPREMARLLEGLERDEWLGRETGLDVLQILRKPKGGAIRGAVPESIVVANKPGGISGVACDAGIVYLARRPFVLAVMTAGARAGGGDEAIAAATRIVAQHFTARAAEPVLSATGVLVEPALVPRAGEAGPIYDVLVRNGTIVDGLGNPPFPGDVAIRGDRIVAVGNVPAGAKARRTIDATGLFVAPGFVDVLDHSGGALRRDGRAESKVRMGVTTAITGEGGTPAPIESLDEYFANVESTGIAINLGTFVGAGQVRRLVLGEVNRAPSPEELSQMCGFVEMAMRKGALGLTSALIYTPASFSTTEELIALATVASRYGGIYASHIRNEGDGLLEAIDEAIAIGETSGAPVEIFHLKCSGRANWGRMPEALARIEAARLRGLDVTADQYPYTASSTSLTATVPDWVHEGGDDAFLARLRDPVQRAKVREAMTPAFAGDAPSRRMLDTWDAVRIASVASAKNRPLQGQTVEAIAKEREVDPRDAVIDLLLEENLRVGALYFKMSEEDVRTALRVPWLHVGSDGGASTEADTSRSHPRRFGTFTRILGHYVRDEKVLPLEEAVAKMTSRPARKFRLRDRGRLEPGAYADVVVFDLENLEDRATFEEPNRYPKGMRNVFVNGECVLDGEAHTGALPGRVLRGPGWEGK